MAESDHNGFFVRTARTTALLAAVVVLWLWATGHGRWAISLLAGVAVAAGSLWLLLLTTERLIRPGANAGRTPRWLVGVQLVKYAVIAGIVFVAFGVARLEPISFIAGVFLPTFVALLRIVGGQCMRALGLRARRD